MDEQTKQTLNEYLSTLLDYAKKGTDFVAEQIPLVIQEKLSYDFAMNIITGILFLIPGICVWGIWYYYCTVEDWDSDEVIPATMLAGVFGTFSFIPAYFYFMDAIKIYAAPRLYIIEWLSTLVK